MYVWLVEQFKQADIKIIATIAELVCVYVCVNTYMHAYILVHIHLGDECEREIARLRSCPMYLYAYTQMGLFAFFCVCVLTNMDIYMNIYKYIYIYRTSVSEKSPGCEVVQVYHKQKKKYQRQMMPLVRCNVYVCMYMCMCVPVYIYMYMYMYFLCVYTREEILRQFVCTHTYIHTKDQKLQCKNRKRCISIYIHTYIRIYIHAHTKQNRDVLQSELNSERSKDTIQEQKTCT